MLRVALSAPAPVMPFGEPARELTILNRPLWELQRQALGPHCRGAMELDRVTDLHAPGIAYRDNLYFDARLIATFVSEARARGGAQQLAFRVSDPVIRAYGGPLQAGFRREGELVLAELYYLPAGYETPRPLVIDSHSREMGYYHVPGYMAPPRGEMVYQVPWRACFSIESWVGIFLVNALVGGFGVAYDEELKVEQSWLWKLRTVGAYALDRLNPFSPSWRHHLFSISRLVRVGKGCSIDPTAQIAGPTVIGDHVTIGAGAVVANCHIGDNVTVGPGSKLFLSTVGDRCFLPFDTGLFLSTLMERTTVAQGACLQMSVVGRDTFIGAGTVLTDFDLLGSAITTLHAGELVPVGMPVIGSAVGHRSRLGSNLTVYPGRQIGSDATIALAHPAAVIARNVEGGVPGESAFYVWPERRGRIDAGHRA